jgi:POT family proton-dependent oligopeptide transporter
MMAVNYLSNAFGNYLAGYLGSYWDGMAKSAFFAMIAGLAAATSVGIFLMARLLNPILQARLKQERPGGVPLDSSKEAVLL